MLKFEPIDTLDISANAGHTNRFSNLPYVGLQVRIKAQKAATAITESMCGRVRVNFRGQEIVNALWSNLRKWQDLLFGKPEVNDGGSGNESDYGIFIPFFHPGLPNAINKESGDGLNFYVEKFGEASCSYATCEISGRVADVPELYIPSLHDTVFTAATGQHKILIKQDNITAIMLTKPATTVQTLLELLIDGDLEYSGDWYQLVNMSNGDARIEATALEVILFDLVQKRKINEALNDSAIIYSTGGAGDFYYFYQSLQFNSARTQRSAERMIQSENALLQRKAQKEGAQIAVMTDPGLVRRETARRVLSATRNPEVRRKIEEIRSRAEITD